MNVEELKAAAEEADSVRHLIQGETWVGSRTESAYGVFKSNLETLKEDIAAIERGRQWPHTSSALRCVERLRELARFNR